MEDRTRIMAEGTEQYPLDPAVAAEAENCPHCEATIPPGEQFCLKCGYQRGTMQQEEGATEGTAMPEEPASSRFVLVSEAGDRLPLPDGQTTIGRGDANIKINDGYVSRLHCRFTVSEDSVSVVDLGSANGTYVDGELITHESPTELTAGSVIKLGQVELTLELVKLEEDVAPAAEETDMPEEQEDRTKEEPSEEPETEDLEEAPGLEPVHMELTPAGSPWTLSREGTDEVLHLPFGGSRLGRKPDKCDIVVRGDGYISGLHCRLVAGEDHLEVTDLGSTNGTHVNHERVAPDQTVTLKAGDMLRIGQTDLRVAYEAGGASEEPELPAPGSEASPE